ncbi:rho guanine nucleotide exchange factor 17 [Poecilia latipinna]|uniref:rho guanine nucleotide exchange factor 17 n=1 Tax=Poecilia latipinna TaxID=48699 RepID=UPI00072E3FA3|nr:PREDICTED: rho guanine nucleotide exchange factor 17 [Poecilia latipinna]
MAEGKKKNAAAYRSVSFKKLGSSRSEEQQQKSEGSESVGVALPPEPSRAEQSWATRNVSVSRKVSKISATATAEPKRGSSALPSSISPSIRQLTEKFNSSSSKRSGGATRTQHASPGDGAAPTRGSSTLPRARGDRIDGSPTRKSFHEDSGEGCFLESDPTTAESLSDSRSLKFHSGTDSVSGSDSEKWIFRRFSAESCKSGKRDYSQISAADLRKSLTTDEEEDVGCKEASLPCKPHRSYRHIPTHSERWPSVTKIRQLFDEKASQLLKTDTCESLKAAGRGYLHDSSYIESDKQSVCISVFDKFASGEESRETSSAKDTFCYCVDIYFKTEHPHPSNDEEGDIENSELSSRSHFHTECNYHRNNSSTCRFHSTSAEAEATCKFPRKAGSTPDPKPDLQPCAAPSSRRSVGLDTSSCCSSLQQPTERERRDIQGVGLPRDSLHSSHSSSRAPAPTTSSISSTPAPDKAITSYSSTIAPPSESGASTKVSSPLSFHWKLSSGDEEEVHSRRKRGGAWSYPTCPASSVTCRGGERSATERGGSYLSRNKNGRWGAKVIGRSSGSEEDSPASIGPHCREAVRRRSLRKKKKISGAALAAGRDDYNDQYGESEGSDSDPALTMDHTERQQQNTGEVTGMIHRSHSAREPGGRSNKARVQHWERLSSPTMSTTLPAVSRVSKVKIPPFVSSPGDSCCSSRYSSTETLKEEDQGDDGSCGANMLFNTSGSQGRTSRAASSSMLSKTYHGNFTMYRSPSFGHGDNFSRAPVRVHPKILPTVTFIPSVTPRESGGSSGVRGLDTVVLRKTTGREAANKANKISTSNPDIASETMTLLNSLKNDVPKLKMRRPSGGDRNRAGECSSEYSRDLGPLSGTVLPSGHRPSLKDLTATLRRTKSFTYSDKITTGARSYLTGGTTKRSSSEQQLDLDDEKTEGRVVVSDREVESDGGDFRFGQNLRTYGLKDEDDNGEVMPTPLEERCVQEARQVIQDICQMCSRDDDDDDLALMSSDSILGNEGLQVKQTDERKKNTGGIKDQMSTAQESENTKDKNKHEQERESKERERSEQSMQLEKLNSRGTDCWEKSNRQTREIERSLLKGDSEESMLYDRSMDELSGHDSSLTDEGIVTEPESGPPDLSVRSFLGSAGVNLGSRVAKDVLGQPLTGWKQSALHEMESFKQEEKTMPESSLNCTNHLNETRFPQSLTYPVCTAQTDNRIVDMSATTFMNKLNNEGINTSSAVSTGFTSAAASGEGGFESPATPSAVRRRRKFSPSGNNNTGSDSSNGSHAESTIAAVGNGESTVYRSLSDPMPQRCCSLAEKGSNNFSSVDSNLLGSLSVKGGASPEASVASTLSEYKGSVASDLSVYSDGGLRDDGIQDYSRVIRNIVAEPGAMDRLITDDHGNGKAPKKKSFSDPSRRSEAPPVSQTDPQTGSTHQVSELDQSGQIPPSSSEPILSEQREELWDLESNRTQLLQAKIAASKSECSAVSDNPDEEDDSIDHYQKEKFNLDLKLAEVLSPRTTRRLAKKRPSKLQSFPDNVQFHPIEMGSEDQEEHSNQSKLISSLPASPLKSKSKTKPKHIRNASEPAAFIPISPPAQLQPLKEVDFQAVTPRDEAQSLEDVSQKYNLEDIEARLASIASNGSQGLIPGAEGSGGTSNIGLTETGPQKIGTEDKLSASAPQKTKPKVDMRKHVMMTLLDTEQSYVESLRTLIQGYMRPLKQPDGSSIVDPLLVDEMFYQIPEILEHHEQFLEQVAGCVGQWHDRQTVGHLLIHSFSKDALADTYSAYIDNFLNAKDAVRIAKEAKPAFHKFLEQNMRENKEKQALGDLMIKPVQRIPRYELLVKDLLKHTPEDHPDHPFLLDAQKNIHRLAEKINKGRRSAEEAEREARVIQEIEAHIEGVEHILNPQRKFLRQEIVMEAKTVGGKKDRSLFLFSDLIICTTLKRKSGSLRRSSMSLYSAASVIDTSSKYKFLWKLPLEDVEVVKSSSQATNRESVQKMITRLDEDLSTLGQISKLSETLSFPHQSLDEVIKDLMASVHKELSEKQSLAFSMTFLPTKLEFTTASAESTFVFEFSSPDARSSFEQAFEDAKKKLAMNKDQWDPEFLKAIPIMKTRSGMQFSCASPSHSCPDSGCEVWVCNSDGYVGQVCLLNIKDEPTVEACIAVCSARIICIAAVPGLKGRDRVSEPAPTSGPPTHPQQQLDISISPSTLEPTEQPTGPGAELVPFDSDDSDDEDSPSPSSTLQSQASHSTISSSYGNDEGVSSKDMATETTSSEEEQEFPVPSSYGAPGMLGVGGGSRAHTESPMDGRAMRRSSRGSFTRASLEDLLSIDPEAYQSSVWLGTEDGCIHVYQSSDNIRNRKNSMKMQHSASILCILYFDNKVFVSLANGEVIVYQREAGELTTKKCADAIIRQHKAACLRITALLACKDLLWIGTSAGVVLTLVIPTVSTGTGAGTLKSPLVPIGSAHGHTGHVRFLTSIELPEGFDMNFPPTTTDSTGNRPPSSSSSVDDGSLQRRDSTHHRTSTHIPVKTNHLVISGGDGYEDFRLTNSSETIGRDDSTNHLLLWRV